MTLVDLHLHTTASDGRLTPADLVAHAAASGVGVLAVTDHDTTGGHDDAAAAAAAQGIEFVPGIEITAVEADRDVHVLGYFVDATSESLKQFLERQRRVRVARLHEVIERLAALGVPVATPPLLERAAVDARISVGRPLVADAMIAAGHVATRREAFDRWLAAGAPAFVPRAGAGVEQVIEITHRAGGLVSLAHPGRTRLPDERIARLAACGLDALEVHHSDHGVVEITHYRALADQLGLLVTGGSDFHGDPAGNLSPGAAHLPRADWERLRARGVGRG